MKSSFRKLLGGLLLLAYAPSHAEEFEWEPGDIIARYAQGFFSQVTANASEQDKRFAHVGIVCHTPESGWQVVHAMPAFDASGVSCVPLESFISKALRYQVYRFKHPLETRTRIALHAEALSHAKIPFDASFNYQDSSAIYCTELIWLAYRDTTGIDMAPHKTIIDGREILTIETIIASEQLEPVTAEIINAATKE